ncbi:hypothetical protein HDU91_002602, partial [Kappamyces sp. JEL0680]
LFWLPHWILVILPYFFPHFVSASPVPVLDSPTKELACSFDAGYGSLLACLVALQVVGLVGVAWKVARARKAFTEFKETRNALAVCAGVAVINLAIGLAKAENDEAGRLAICLTQLIAATIWVWCSVTKALVGFIFDPDTYLARWRYALRGEDLPDELNYGVGNRPRSGGSYATAAQVIDQYQSSIFFTSAEFPAAGTLTKENVYGPRYTGQR